MEGDSEDSASTTSLSSSSSLASLSNSPGPSPGASSDSSGDQQAQQAIRWPAGYPLPINDTYYSWPPDDATPDPAHTPTPDPVDPRARTFRSLYNIDLLDRRRPPAAAGGPGADYGVLRKKWNTRFQRAHNGGWDYVEYAPAWTDPDWDERYVYTGPNAVAWPADHPLAGQYVKPGTFQTQRPALLASDRALRPTATAKRWGVYPYQAGDRDRSGAAARDGSSGVTPTTLSAFPSVPLARPRWSNAFRALRTVVTVEEIWEQRERYDLETRAAGGESSDEGFRAWLVDATNRLSPETDEWDLADKVLQLSDFLLDTNRRRDYQSVMFAGHTTNEVRMDDHELVFKQRRQDQIYR